ncbi:xanthine dehydrogenase family protein molybdopterin-binding subunit [Pacificitalea manganoxidans]|nr:molybdopterin cofactor-binding domain-containing protein [Pacificitalea manganoxidans]MDR6309530.1 CO/xanthine dehydrogenase Mo-binding subunit [Pacificitalea manganoxidans]
MSPRDLAPPMTEADALSRTVDAKARGHFRYLADAPPPGTLHGAVLRSPHAHARVLHVDVTAARAIPGVHVVLGPDDVPPEFRYGLRLQDQPPLAQGTVRYHGEPVAILAAETAEIAARALAAIVVHYAPLEVVSDPAVALQTGVPVHPQGNLCHRFSFGRGDIAQAFAAAAHQITLQLETPRQMHAAMELEGGVAWREADDLVIRAPSQDPFYVARSVARLLGLTPAQVRVTGSPIGGGFGGKEDLHIQPLLALLAWHASRPVRLVMSRADSITAGYKRHPFRIDLRLGCDAAGRLLALDAQVLADTGAYASHGPEVLDTAMETIQGAYAFPAVRLEGRLAYTNNGVSGAFRGFGATQVQTALEAGIDQLARRARIDPLDFRRRNLAPATGDGPLDQDMVPQPELAWIGDRMAALPAPAPNTQLRYLTACGSALVRKGEGFGADGPNGAAGRLMLSAQGQITLVASLTDMGQGLTTAVRRMLCAQFDVQVDDVAVALGQTDADGAAAPDSGATSASRGSQIAQRLIRKGATGFTQAVLSRAASRLGCAADDLTFGAGGIYRTTARSNQPDLSFAALAGITEDITIPGLQATHGHPSAHSVFTACGARAEVAIDRWTGTVRVTRITLVPACGPPLSRSAFDGQMAGGAVQALGFVLTETLPTQEGRFTATNLDGYFIPTIADAPEICVEPIETLDPDDPVGLRGAGEIGLNAAAPAILCAVQEALGAAPPCLPVPAGWVLEQLKGLA